MKVKHTEDNIISIWDQFYLYKKMPAWLFFSMSAAIIFFAGYVLIKLFEEQLFLKTQISLSLLISWALVSNHYSFNQYRTIITHKAPLFSKNIEESLGDKTWGKAIKAYNLSTPGSKILTALIIACGVITVILLGMPFENQILNYISIAALIPLFAICGHSAFVGYSLAVDLHELSKHRIYVPFMLFPPPQVSNISSFYLLIIMFYVVGYLFLALAVYYGPYGLHSVMVGWLTILAFYPLGLIFVWAIKIHQIKNAIRFDFIVRVNDMLNRALEKYENTEDLTMTTLEKVTKLMELQKSVSHLRIWPFDLKFIFVFLLSLITAAVQILLIVSNIY